MNTWCLLVAAVHTDKHGDTGLAILFFFSPAFVPTCKNSLASFMRPQHQSSADHTWLSHYNRHTPTQTQRHTLGPRTRSPPPQAEPLHSTPLCSQIFSCVPLLPTPCSPLPRARLWPREKCSCEKCPSSKLLATPPPLCKLVFFHRWFWLCGLPRTPFVRQQTVADNLLDNGLIIKVILFHPLNEGRKCCFSF